MTVKLAMMREIVKVAIVMALAVTAVLQVEAPYIPHLDHT